ncbi:MAG: hypothetical protein WD066_08055 [Planctomycetaceae bacterium]
MRAFLVGVALLCVPAAGRADSITLGSSGSLECVVLQDDATHVTVLYQSSVLRMNRSSVRSIQKEVQKPDSASAKSDRNSRLPQFRSALVAMGGKKWATELRQIPATVIDVGVLRHVPYKSIRCGTNYEFNLYGDPDEPAAFEIGIHKNLLTDEQAKRNCLEFIGGFLSESDRAILAAMNLEADSVVRNGLTLEITPPSAEDAYGGWWVSVYDEKKLDALRATDQELGSITVANRVESGGSSTQRTSSRSGSALPADHDELERLQEWTADDLRQARAPRPTPASTTPSSGLVYVRGYYRKDGTYVRPHTRSAARR